MAISTVEHIGLFDADSDGDLKAVAELARILRPGGLLVLTVPFASKHLEIPMRQRIYDSASLHRLLARFEEPSVMTYAYSPARLWTQVDPGSVPEPSAYTTHCTALVTACTPKAGDRERAGAGARRAKRN